MMGSCLLAMPCSVRRVHSGRAASKGGGPSWLDGAVRHELMDPGTAQVTALELTTKMMEAAQAKGARVVKGTVEVSGPWRRLKHARACSWRGLGS